MTRMALIALVTGVVFGGQTAQAGHYEHLDRLALRLQSQARELYREFNLHYAHAAEGRHLLSDASAMYYKARHVHEVAHHGGSVHHLRSDVNELDRLFHHVEALVSRIEHRHRHGHDLFGHGHVHGRTWHVRVLLSRMADTLHHMQSDVNALAREHRHDHGHDGPGVVIGGRGFRFRIGF